MRNCWVIGRTKKGIPYNFLVKTLKQYDYNVYFLDVAQESFSTGTWRWFPKPHYIFYDGTEKDFPLVVSELIRYFGTSDFPQFIVISPISPYFLLKIKEIHIYSLVFLYEGEQVKGVILGIAHQANRHRGLRNIFRSQSFSFMVMNLIEAFVLHELYYHWKAYGTDFIEQLNKYCKEYLCDGIAILRGLGLDPAIGQRGSLPSLIQKEEIPFLLHCIRTLGCKNITLWGEPGDIREGSFIHELKCSFSVQSCVEAPFWDSVKGSDLLILLSKVQNVKGIKINDWERNRHLFHLPHIMDCQGLYEPAELEEIGYRYFSLFRYKSFINGEK